MVSDTTPAITHKLPAITLRRAVEAVAQAGLMLRIKVQYDAYNRQFKILDRELARKLEDREVYMLIAPQLTISRQPLNPIETSEKQGSKNQTDHGRLQRSFTS
jgi:hypothetical protein